MPKVPRFEQGGIREAPIPSVRVSTDAPIEAFGGTGQVERAVGGLAGVVTQIALKEKRRADDIASIATDNRISELQTNVQIEAKKLRGRDALGATEVVEKMWKEGLAEIQKGVNGRAQRDAFQRASDSRFQVVNRQVQLHEAEQSRVYDNEVTTAAVATSRNNAALNAANDEAINKELDRTRAIIISHSERNGIPLASEIHKERETVAISALNTSVINSRLASGDYVGAKVYFDEKKAAKEFTARDLKQIDAAIKEGRIRGLSQTKATEIMAKDLTLVQSLEEARKTKDPEIQDAIVRRIKARFAENEKSQDKTKEENFQFSADVVEATEARPEPALWNELSLRERNAIDRRIEFLKSGKVNVTDLGIFYELEQLSSIPSKRQEWLKTNLLIPFMEGKLSKSDFQKLSSLQAKSRRGGEEFQLDIDGITSKTAIVTAAIETLGLKGILVSKKKVKVRENLFRRRVDQEKVSFEKRHGRKITNEDLRQIVDLMASEIITDEGLIPFSFAFGFGQEEELGFEVDLDDIPDDTETQIRQKLQQNNIQVTDENIISVFIRMKSPDGR